MLGQLLPSLDIPADGVRLVSLKTSYDEAGYQTWTVVFKSKEPAGKEMPYHEAPPKAHAKAAAMISPGHARTPSADLTGTTPSKSIKAFLSPIDGLAETPKTFAPREEALSHGQPSVQDPRMDRIFPLKCQAKTYDWGKRGSDSLVGRLAVHDEDFSLEAKTPYAELWMGTHKSGPSNVTLSSPWRTVTPLSDWIKLNPALLGPPRPSSHAPAMATRRESMRRADSHSLPFLFKILSVRTALSIQAHPDKTLAAELHIRHPEFYKDDNHKPEMAVAITPFEALCSFQPAFSILANCRATPELVALVGEDAVSRLDDTATTRAAAQRASPTLGGTQSADGRDPGAAFREALKTLFARLMSAPADQVKAQLDALMKRVQSTNEMLRTAVDVLAMRIHAQYPGDVGVFCVYLLNYTLLQPGEALFLAANEPHAYIFGDCAEIMATSDNVVRAGCTSKWKDVDTLCDMLTYSDGPPCFVEPVRQPSEPHVWRYSPPAEVDEFLLERIELPEDGLVARMDATEGLAILLVVNGTAAIEQLDDITDNTVGLRHQLAAGAVHLVCPNTVLRIKATSKGTQLFRAAAKPLDESI